MIRRDLEKPLIEAAKQFSAVAVVGPRQSGKTTLVQFVIYAGQEIQRWHGTKVVGWQHAGTLLKSILS